MTKGTNGVPSARPSGTAEGISGLRRPASSWAAPCCLHVSHKVYFTFQRFKIWGGGTVPICPLLMLPKVDAKHFLSSGAVNGGLGVGDASRDGRRCEHGSKPQGLIFTPTLKFLIMTERRN